MERIRVGEDAIKRTVENYVKFKVDFEVHYSPNSISVIQGDTKYIHVSRENNIEGSHLIGILAKAVNKIDFTPPTGLTEPIMDKFKLDNIEANLEQICTKIDLKSAFWTAAWKLGYINSKQFFCSWDKKEWKKGAVAAVGALNKKVFADKFVNGVIVEKGVLIEQDKIKQDIRLHIINYVSDIMKECSRIAGNDKWLMIQTDAITVIDDYQPMNDIFNYIESIGFRWHTKKIMFHEVQNYKIIASNFPDDNQFVIHYSDLTLR